MNRIHKKALSVLQQTRGSKVDLTLRHVQVFFLLWHNAGRFKDVANWVGITQPAISASLSSLENICGFELFFRGRGRHVTPNNTALRLYPYFDRAFRAMNDLAVEIERARINPQFGVPFRKFRALLEPMDFEHTSADELAKEIAKGTAREDTEKKA